MHLANYLGYLHRAELNLAEGFRKVGEAHAEEADVYHTCNTLAKAPIPTFKMESPVSKLRRSWCR